MFMRISCLSVVASLRTVLSLRGVAPKRSEGGRRSNLPAFYFNLCEEFNAKFKTKFDNGMSLTTFLGEIAGLELAI